MAFPTTKQCCCGCSLRTGVLILGYLGVVGAILQLLQFAAQPSAQVHGDPVADHVNGQKIQTTNPVATIITGILSAILLYGVYQGSRAAILSVVYIQLGLSFFGLIGIVAFAFIVDALWILPIFLVILSIQLYFSWVEYSYAEELKEQSTSPKSYA